MLHISILTLGISLFAATADGTVAETVAASAIRPDALTAATEITAKRRREAAQPVTNQPEKTTDYVGPRIGSEGLGRVFIGPSCPFGMVKPSPDCTVSSNSGWLPMPTQVDGFAQTHVSGTGGGPKYGNILVTPFCEGMDRTQHIDYREYEDIRLGYYDTSFQRTGIRTEITTAPHASFYRFTYPQDSLKSLAIDAGFFLGENPVPDTREAQQFVGSEIQILSDHEVCGYSRIRGGWNNGKAYTVYFHAETDKPFTEAATWKGTEINTEKEQYDSHQKTGALVRFDNREDVVLLKVGISFLSCQKARENMRTDIPHWSFETTRQQLVDQWEGLFSKIEIASDTPEKLKRMFYTGLYHTMLMPVDRTGENPLWSDAEPYYDDFYAIWDTYRSSFPLITLMDPQRMTDIVRSLINIGKRDGYMPDARSGNSNGRTQGGSNAEIVIADAFVKGLDGIDYGAALEAMLKDATADPGDRHEAEGRGGIDEYLQLGYVPYGIDRAGNRTVEYAYCDYAIATVAKGLGKEELYRQYLKQSGNWKNLWNADYEHDGARGFILPRDKEGNWLTQLPFGHSRKQKPTFTYTPLIFEGPWYKPWWGMFFYEASSWEYSLSIPHDVPGLIGQCGGAEAFEDRLDTFFDREYYNVNNEPSFLTPCLYHWIGKPWRSGSRILSIIRRHYCDTPMGLPGNDDSGAMSSWLAFHMTGIYPNAGQDYYIIHTPMLKETVFHLQDGKDFRIKAEGLSESNSFIQSVTLNGTDYPYSVLRHSDLVAGGELVLKMGKKPSAWGKQMFPEHPELTLVSIATEGKESKTSQYEGLGTVVTPAQEDSYLFVFKLHGQTRKYQVSFTRGEDSSLRMDWGIMRNLRWQSGSYTMSPEAVENGHSLNFRQPEDGNHLTLPDGETAYILSQQAYKHLKANGQLIYNDVTYKLMDTTTEAGRTLLHLKDPEENAELWIWDNPTLPLICQMQNNPLEIDWTVVFDEK